MKKSAKPYFSFIRDAVNAIESYTPDTEEAFLASEMTRDAVLMRLQEIGENLARIRSLDDERFRANAPESWHKLIGLRNIISHGYQSIDWARVWTSVRDELPELKISIEPYLDEINWLADGEY